MIEAYVVIKDHKVTLVARRPEARLKLLRLIDFRLELESSSDGEDGVETVVYRLIPKEK